VLSEAGTEEVLCIDARTTYVKMSNSTSSLLYRPFESFLCTPFSATFANFGQKMDVNLKKQN
jgi:hypothetical protein